MLCNMKRKEFLEKINQLNMVVKINLNCCEIFFDYFSKYRGHKHAALLTMLQKGTDYMSLALINHFHQAILVLNSLLNPSKSIKTKEVSPYNKILDLDNKASNDLYKIQKKFNDFKLHKLRNEIIAHKENLDQINLYNLTMIPIEKNLFKKVQTIQEMFEKWLKDNFIVDTSYRFENYGEKDLNRIIKLFEDGENRFRKDLYENWVLNSK